MYSSDDETTPVPEKKVRKQPCPICESTIALDDARCVGWYGSSEETVMPTEGGKVILRLMERPPGSTLVYPRDTDAKLPRNEGVPWYQTGDVADYARIMKGGEDYMAHHYDAELRALQQQEKEDALMFGDDTRWVRKAMSSVREARKSIEGIGNPVFKSAVSSREPPDAAAGSVLHQHAAGQDDASPPPTNENENELSSQFSNIDSPSANQEPASISKSHQTHHRKHHDTHPSPRASERTFYFYQALPHFYLSSLDIRILRAAFGSYEQFPDTIIPEIERISTGHTVDEELRRRVKFLSHLPLGCEVNFLECDLTGVVSPTVLETFKDEILQRRRHNHEKAAREEQERIRAEKNESRGWASARKKHNDDFAYLEPAESPRFTDKDFAPLTPSTPLNSTEALAGPSQPAQTARTIWGTTMNTWPTEDAESPATPPQPDGWLDNWQMEQQFYGAPSADATATPDQGGGTGGGGGKKKKGKKITLMSTTARRGA